MGWFRRRRRDHDRDTQYVATNTETGVSQTFTIFDNLAPDFSGRFYRNGMSLPCAWRSANIIADLIGAMPWHAFRERAGNPVEKLNPTPPLLEQPNPEETRISTF